MCWCSADLDVVVSAISAGRVENAPFLPQSNKSFSSRSEQIAAGQKRQRVVQDSVVKRRESSDV